MRETIPIYIYENDNKYGFSTYPSYATILECRITKELFKTLIDTTLDRVDAILRDMYKKEVIERLDGKDYDSCEILFDNSAQGEKEKIN